MTLFAKPKADIQLIEVDALIEQRRINEALSLVQEYIIENPRDFDNAQKRVDIIFQARNDYKAKADELVRIIVDDPLNDKLKLDIIEELETMEANPNIEEREFIAKIKVTSQFTYFRALYEQIVQEGTDLLNEKNYTASAERFTDGFELYYNDFFEKGFDSTLIQDVIDELAEANKSVNDYATIQSNLIAEFAQFNTVLNENNAESSLSEYNTILQVLNNFAQVRNESILAGFYFEEQTEILQAQNPDLTDAFFLPFAFRLLLGRGDEEEAHIVKAMDTQWNDLYEQTKLSLASIIASYANDLNTTLVTQRTQDINTNAVSTQQKITTLESLINMGSDFLSQYTLLHDSQTTFETNPYTEYQSVLDYGSYLVAQGETLLEYANLLANEQQSIETFTVSSNPETFIRSRSTDYTSFLATSAQTLEGYAQSLLEDTNALQQQEQAMEELSMQFTASEGALYPSFTLLKQTLEAHLETLAQSNYSDALVAWEDASDFIAQGSGVIRDEYDTPYTQAVTLINEELDITLQSDPAGALALLENISSTIETEIESLQIYQDFLGSASLNPGIGIQSSTDYSENNNQVAQDIAFLSNISESTDSYIILAEQRIRLAQQAQNEANLRYTQAQEYLDQENFAASRDSVQRARTKYNESLSYQYTAALQEGSDEQLAALGEEISFTENEIVVRNVRNFITQSRQNYYNSNFAQAESLILQAESQWAITNVQENPEIIALKALIGNALSITTGRSIPSTDPLYPEMSQTLNVAYQHYDNAENLLARNNREQALIELELARNKIRDVQVLYPFHQEASLLALQIDELIDPVAFQEQFTQKFEQAQADYRSPATSSRAYIDLLDLYEINPNYPGLEDFIYVVELELGIILPPPNLAALAQSTTLTQEAENLYDSGARDEITLNNALALLNEAIELNAENQDALILLDRINTSLGGAAVIVLSSEAENLYQQAVQELSNGNTITAAALVGQLLQLPGVENSSKIIDLQRRVESLL